MEIEQTQLDEYTDSTVGLTAKQVELVAEIERLGEELDRRPKLADLKDLSEYSRYSYRTHFDSWSAAFEYTKFDKKRGVSDEELLDEVRRVAEKLGRLPRLRNFREHGKYSHTTYGNRFESWNVVLEKAGVKSEFRRGSWAGFEIPTGKLIDEMLRVANVVGRPPTQVEMREVGGFSVEVYKRRFGSWGEAHEFAGLPPRKAIEVATEDEGPSEEYGANWTESRRQALVRDRWRCQSCGMKQQEHVDRYDGSLHVHHIIPIKEFDEPEQANFGENLITLCKSCHVKWEDVRRSEGRIGGEMV